MFEYSLDTLENYVTSSQLDAIAITNHNVFDKDQFLEIKSSVKAKVFPGIEVDVEGCHLLLIADDDDLIEFTEKCSKVSDLIPDNKSMITVEKLKEVFGDLSNYLIIPHYSKSPTISQLTLSKLSQYICVGEVSSVKKFLTELKKEKSLVPVLFSDSRMRIDLKMLPSKYTYIDVGEITLKSMKLSLSDKNKVFLTEKEGHKFFEVLGGKLKVSTGLNVMIGERSSGKSYTLNRIYDEVSTDEARVKYIKQFSLLQKDEDDERDFSKSLKISQSSITENFLKEFREAIRGIEIVDQVKTERHLERFVNTLIKHANELDRHDSFASTRFFSESPYHLNTLESLSKLINSAIDLFENTEFKSIINNHIKDNALKNLVLDLISEYTKQRNIELIKKFVNDIVEDIKSELKIFTSATIIDDIDFYQLSMDLKKIEKFNELTSYLIQDKEFFRQDISGFSKVAKSTPFQNARDLGTLYGRKVSFALAFEHYWSDGYKYLCKLKETGIDSADFYKLFVKVDYVVLNSKGFPVSGGERSEFRLLQEISDAHEYDLLLIDEPESSFDNVFLLNRVNALIKEISSTMPVVLVTHNNTVGASISPDYIIYTSREIKADSVHYRIYTGYPSDKFLFAEDGSSTESHNVILNCLEAGENSYYDRKERYEMLKDRKR